MSNGNYIYPEIKNRLSRQDFEAKTLVDCGLEERVATLIDYVSELGNCVLLMAETIDNNFSSVELLNTKTNKILARLKKLEDKT